MAKLGILDVQSALMAAVMDDDEEVESEDGRKRGVCRDRKQLGSLCRGMLVESARNLGPPFSQLELPQNLSMHEGSETRPSWNIRNACELALAIACSYRHAGCSEDQSLIANSRVLFREMKKTVIRSSFPERLQPLFEALVLTRRNTQSEEAQASGSLGGGCYPFAAALRSFFFELHVHPKRSELFPWLTRSMSRLLQTVRSRIPSSEFDHPLLQLIEFLESTSDIFEASDEEVTALRTLDDQLFDRHALIHKIVTCDCLAPSVCRRSETSGIQDLHGIRQVVKRGRESLWLRSRVATRFALFRLLERTRCESLLIMLLHQGLACKLQPERCENLTQTDFDDVAAIVSLYQESASFHALHDIASSEELNSLSYSLLALLEFQLHTTDLAIQGEEKSLQVSLNDMYKKFVSDKNSTALSFCIFDLAQRVNKSTIHHSGTIAALITFGSFMSLKQSLSSEHPCSCSFWLIYITVMRCIGKVGEDGECERGAEDSFVGTRDKVDAHQVMATLILSSLMRLIESLDHQLNHVYDSFQREVARVACLLGEGRISSSFQHLKIAINKRLHTRRD
ncbi:hypothetical protein GUITHDRAFT_136242 [Guillardia theta CCMP2712]|uniref:Uncharacterized protein n=1 Tax=Guillardia theta (strain CCMP2712) TaxID=905079 RepID=L1JLP6_GUITC|nr:hypothetical protein GUITHDRAFT_136242 [Guillardia theta CCMP2712]EKX49060.1 hypothetical protein GUITHDRAFT_136242 [Guillardia theta CCMP2712]|eukprot:XP_005836040.1 hypothetical protein GUITHDRAFT_136242 [Guillardia theta CCMP2712]